MHKVICLLLATPALLVAQVSGGGESNMRSATVYVAPKGNDAWSGRFQKPNGTKTDGPFATLERARNEVRKIDKSQLAEGSITVEIAGGVYELKRPVEFTAADSGTETCPIAYVARPGETPVLSGGVRVMGFKPYKGKIVCADVPQVREGSREPTPLDHGPDFLRLANVLSALFPMDSDQKQLLVGMLLAVPR